MGALRTYVTCSPSKCAQREISRKFSRSLTQVLISVTDPKCSRRRPFVGRAAQLSAAYRPQPRSSTACARAPSLVDRTAALLTQGNWRSTSKATPATLTERVDKIEPRSQAARFTGWAPSARAPCKAPAHTLYTCVRLRLLLSEQLGLVLVHRRARGRCWRESNTNTPTSAPPARARGRKPNVYFAMCRAQKHVGGVGAREAATTKPQRETMREAGGRGTEVGVSRACDEKDFRDCVTGEGMGCVREDNLVSPPTGRCDRGTWGYIEGPRTKAQTW